MHDLTRPLEQRRLRDHLIEPGGVRAAEPGRVGVVRVAEQRGRRVRVRHFDRIDARDVRDHEIGRVDPINRFEAVLGQKRLELSADEEVDPTQQDRRHVCARR